MDNLRKFQGHSSVPSILLVDFMITLSAPLMHPTAYWSLLLGHGCSGCWLLIAWPHLLSLQSLTCCRLPQWHLVLAPAAAPTGALTDPQWSVHRNAGACTDSYLNTIVWLGWHDRLWEDQPERGYWGLQCCPTQASGLGGNGFSLHLSTCWKTAHRQPATPLTLDELAFLR